MHIPDGFLSAGTWIPAWGVSVAAIGIALKKTKRVLKERMIPLMGLAAAFIFAAQMLNFPVAGGTSGHLLGGVLAAVLLGPWAGMIVISVVLVVQCLLFQDGGLTALGANILNMGLIGTVCSYYVYKGISKTIGGRRGVLSGTAVAAWLSVVMASSACALELASSGTSPLKITFVAMAGVHALIGIGEAVFTTLIIGFILKVRPDLIYED